MQYSPIAHSLVMKGPQTNQRVIAVGFGLVLFCLVLEARSSGISLLCSSSAISQCRSATEEIQRAVSSNGAPTVSFTRSNYTLPTTTADINNISASQSATEGTLVVSLLCSDSVSLGLSTASNVRNTNQSEQNIYLSYLLFFTFQLSR